MKLTNYQRDAFITAVMDDVPQVDYQAKIQKAVTDDAINQLPPKVAAVFRDSATRPYINTATWGRWSHRVAVPCMDHEFKPTPEGAKALTALEDAAKAQDDIRSNLKARLRAVAYGCTTLKALQESLPEFAKYMPKDTPTPTRSLPVVASVVADFKAAGWPDKKSA